MQVRHGEPAFPLMKKREAAIEQDFIGNERLVRTEGQHLKRQVRQNYRLPRLPSIGNERLSAPMSTYLKFAGLAAAVCLFASCETPTPQASRQIPTAHGKRITNVRTTAYTHS